MSLNEVMLQRVGNNDQTTQSPVPKQPSEDIPLVWRKMFSSIVDLKNDF